MKSSGIEKALLQASQLREHPDSRFIAVDEAFAWARQDPPWFVEARSREWSELCGLFDVPSARDMLARWVRETRLTHEANVLRFLAVCFSNACLCGGVLQFYECGLTPDGIYRYRGCRYGVEPHEYSSLG